MVDSGNTYRDKVSRLVSWGHWFSFFNIIVAMLLGTRYIAHSGWPETLLGQTYQVLTWIGHFGFLVFAIYILIIFPASFLITNEKLMRLFAVFVSTIGLTALILDIYAYETLRLHLPLSIWELILSSDSEESNAGWQYLFIAVPIIFLLELLMAEWVWKKLRVLSRKQLGIPITSVFATCFIASHLIHIWADAFLYTPITSQRSDFPVSYPMTAKSLMEKYGLLDAQEYNARRDALNETESHLLNYPINALSLNLPSTDKQPNVLMVMLDSVRADLVTPLFMPNLYAFGTENAFFPQHYSTSNDSMGGLFGLFYGLPPSYAASMRTEGISPLLIEQLTKLQYQFGLFSATNFNNPIYSRNIFGSLLQNAHRIDATETWRADKEATTKLTQWIGQQDHPWFGYLELSTVTSFDKKGNYPELFQPSLTGKETGDVSNPLLAKNSYYNAVHYVDSLLGTLLSYLTNYNQWEKTILIITSAHGFEFNETHTDSWGKNSNYSDYQIKVPLIIHWPKKLNKDITHVTSHLDIAPTLMKQALGVTNPATDFSSGVDLLSQEKTNRQWILAGDSRDIVIVQPDKTIVLDKFGQYKLFDSNYKMQSESKPPLSILMNVMGEHERFYQRNGQH